MFVGLCSRKPIKSSDMKYLEQLFEEQRHFMIRIAKSNLICVSDYEDVVQESVIKLIDKVHTLKTLNERHLLSYLAKAVRNTAYDFNKKKRPLSLNMDKIEESQTDTHALPEEFAELIYKKDLLVRVWNCLTEEERFILEGRELGYTDTELAEQICCKPDSIRMKRTRARRKLAEMISQLEEQENECE